MVIQLSSSSDNTTITCLSVAVAIRETDSIELCEAPSNDGKEVVKGRLRTLLELALAIGSREGLLRKNDHSDIKGGQDVANKGNIRDSKAA